MKIESLIRRKNGTRVQLDAPTVHYHFKPTDTDPRHLADVSEESHIATLLRIRDGYAPAEGEEPPQGKQETDLSQFDRQLAGSTIHNATYPIQGGEEISLKELVEMAFEDSGLDEAQWNDLADQERYEFIDRVLAELQGKSEDDDTPPPSQQDNTPPQDGAPPPPPADENKSDTPPAENTDDGKDDDRDHWAAEYKKLFGRNPNKNLTTAQLKRAVKDA